MAYNGARIIKGMPKIAVRKKGTPNRSTSQIKSLIQQFIDANIDQLQRDFNDMEPKDRLAFFERLFIKSVLHGDRKMVEQLLDTRIPNGDCVSLFCDRDADGNYVAGEYKLTAGKLTYPWLIKKCPIILQK